MSGYEMDVDFITRSMDSVAYDVFRAVANVEHMADDLPVSLPKAFGVELIEKVSVAQLVGRFATAMVAELRFFPDMYS